MTTDIARVFSVAQSRCRHRPPEDSEWPRVAQLTQRTNQFNFTTVRRNEPEMRGLVSGEHSITRKSARPIGDYGLVGSSSRMPCEDSLVVDTFLLSCRVLGRGVEHTILRRLGEIARERICPT